jgi:hypothetical protein
MNILLSRVCERIEAAFMVNANYFCLPGEGRDPCFRLSEPVKQLQCLTERLSVRAGGAMGPGLRRGEEWMIGGGLFHKLSGRRFDQHAL